MYPPLPSLFKRLSYFTDLLKEDMSAQSQKKKTNPMMLQFLRRFGGFRLTVVMDLG